METGKILPCTCVNETQDKMHGKGNRLFNPCKPAKLPSEKWYRCTVCNKEVQS
jgi:hypothetical protein